MASNKAEQVINPTRLVPLTTLGRGSYGKVILAKSEDTNLPQNALVAVKVVSKIRIKTKGQLLKNETELRVMREVSPTCAFLVDTLGGYQTDHCLFYIMPYNAGGELFFHLQRLQHFPERECRQICMQVVLALEHLHSHGIVYRDLKPENVLINNTGVCQLADFGLSKYLPLSDSAAAVGSGKGGGTEPGSSGNTQNATRRSSRSVAMGMANRVRNIFRSQTNSNAASGSTPTAAAMGDVDSGLVWGRTKTRCGSPAYQSPEIVEAREHGLEADWWALGIFIYELLVGHPPFFADTVKEVYELILRNEPRWSRKLTDNARDIIQRLLKTDWKQRLGYGEHEGRQELKSHVFFMNTEPATPGERYCTWDEVIRLDTKPCVYLSETGVVGAPEDAVFFHSEYTSIDVREYVPLCAKKIELEGFKQVSTTTFAQFVSAEPIPVGDKGGGGQDELVKKQF